MEPGATRTAARLALLALAVATATALLLARHPRENGAAGARGAPGTSAPVPAAPPADPELRDAASWAGRGAWDSAAVVLTAYARKNPRRPDALVDAYALAAVGAWMGTLGRDRAGAFGAAPRRSSEDLSPARQAEVAWLDGLLSFTDGDRGGLDEARLRAREAGAALSTDLERSLRAFQLALGGDELRAARLLRRLEEDRAGRPAGSTTPETGAPLLTPVDRIAAAHWFIRNGRSDDGLAMLEPPERVLAPGGVADLALAGFVHLERARAHAAMGAPGKANAEFSEFLRAYDLPEGPARGWVRDARSALSHDSVPSH